mmetsp:Transcript_86304/g.252493  ORF Transcript_86304/g.252493 Transcript_86304/m.252493 type:complete len:236 (+) Transcript_86304:998-1705(+)
MLDALLDQPEHVIQKEGQRRQVRPKEPHQRSERREARGRAHGSRPAGSRPLRAAVRGAVGPPLIAILQLVVDVIEEWLDHPIEDHAPRVLVKDSAPVIAQAVKHPIQRRGTDVAPGVAHEHRKAAEDWKPVRSRMAGAGLRHRLRGAAAHAHQGAHGRRGRAGLRVVGEVLRRLQQVRDGLEGDREVGLALAEGQEAPHAVGEVLDEEVVAHLDDLLDASKGGLRNDLTAVLLRS